jgi:ATP adenylyltransferase
MAISFETLRDFIQKRMRMAHVYQPVMIKELLRHGGKTTIRNIASAFLSHDESQIEYYEQITKNMPGKVLGKHGVVQRDGNEYRLSLDPSLLSPSERDELMALCDDAIRDYLQRTRNGCVRSSTNCLGGKPSL